LVVGRAEDAVECEGELDHAQVGADGAAVGGGDRNDLVANLASELRELGGGERFDVGGSADAIEKSRIIGRGGRDVGGSVH
jgi:hypothetical protein